MKKKMIVLATLTAVTLSSGSALAEPHRPVIEAAQNATPRQRMMASEFVRDAYPGLPQDMYSQLKAEYPNLEHGVVDAILATWEQHPGEMLEIALETKEKFGPRMKNLRTKVRQELETSYPGFKERLKGVLSEHGIAARMTAFMEGYDPGLLDSFRGRMKSNFSGWYPGKFREMKANAAPGETPVFDKLAGFVKKNPELGPKIAKGMVQMTRNRAPGLAEDVAEHFIQDHGRLRDALRAEFPGARERIVSVIEAEDPELPGEVAHFVRAERSAIRADLRNNLDAELPGIEAKVESIIEARYPDLRDQILARLK